MCGIAGIIHKGKSTNVGGEMQKMLQSLKHRGPDSTGYALYGNGESNNYILRFKVGENVKEGSSAVMEDASVYETLLAGTDTVSSIINNITYDKRNSPYKPSSGSLTKFVSTIAGLGGTSYYIKNNFDYRKYRRLSKDFIGAFKFEAGHLNGYNDKYAPISANYKLGGKNLRGFKSGRIGPKSGNSYYGGHYYYLTSLETNLDLPLNEFDITSTFFVDAGSVWGLDSRYGAIDDEHNLRSSVGINLNWDSAIGPINLIYAKPISKEDTDTVDSFYFDIGYNF